MTTNDESVPNDGNREDELTRLAGGRSRGPGRELFSFLAQNKKWWLLPIVCGLLVVSAIAGVTSTAVAPFIYALF